MTANNISLFRLKSRWENMKQRCNNPNNQGYKNYGGRGIKVCGRWHSFENFYADMGDCPEGLTLERKDNDGNYEPGNCRWATWKEQGKNKRRPVKNHGPLATLYVNNVPSDLIVQAKVAAATAEMTLKAWIIEAIQEKADKEK